jgi:hypothetical protein
MQIDSLLCHVLDLPEADGPRNSENRIAVSEDSDVLLSPQNRSEDDARYNREAPDDEGTNRLPLTCNHYFPFT